MMGFLGKNRASGEPMTSMDRTIRFGFWSVVIGFGGFLIWAALAPLSEGVIAIGSVVLDGKRKTVQHLEGGIVRTIHVREGDRVELGQVLIELDSTQNQAQRDIFLMRHYTALAVLDRLRSERSGDNELQFGPKLEGARDDPRVSDLMDIQTALFAARQAQLQGQIKIFGQRVTQLQRQITGLEAEKSARQEESGYIADELSRVENLYERGLIGLPRLLEQKKALSQTQGAFGKLEADLGATQVEIGRAQLEILQLEIDHQEEIAELTLKTQEQLFEVQEQLTSVTDILERMKVRAPQSGKILNLQISTVGGVISPGAQILDIVPDERRLVIEVRVRNTDIDNVRIGMPARVKLLALKTRDTPDLNGEIEDVSADIMTDEATRESYYLARVAISEDEFSRVERDTVVPGMPVEVLIEAGSRTALEYLMDPISQVLRRSMTEN